MLFEFDPDSELPISKLSVDAAISHISTPAVTCIPAGVLHCPLILKRDNKMIFLSLY
jgi:hypothetical protein